ncbi:MAG: potassium channel family protein, partial [Planctomycetota bacterium]
MKMSTVGYGDITPQTVPGKVVAAMLIVVGYSLIIVPTGVLSAEMATKASRR